MACRKLNVDLNGRLPKLKSLYNKAIQFGRIVYLSNDIMQKNVQNNT